MRVAERIAAAIDEVHTVFEQTAVVPGAIRELDRLEPMQRVQLRTVAHAGRRARAS